MLSPAKGETPEGILIATGSEVDLAVKAQKNLLMLAKMFLLFQCQVLILLKNNQRNTKKVSCQKCQETRSN